MSERRRPILRRATARSLGCARDVFADLCHAVGRVEARVPSVVQYAVCEEVDSAVRREVKNAARKHINDLSLLHAAIHAATVEVEAAGEPSWSAAVSVPFSKNQGPPFTSMAKNSTAKCMHRMRAFR